MHVLQGGLNAAKFFNVLHDFQFLFDFGILNAGHNSAQPHLKGAICVYLSPFQLAFGHQALALGIGFAGEALDQRSKMSCRAQWLSAKVFALVYWWTKDAHNSDT